MIILDTNILEKAKLGTTSTDLLKVIGTSGVDVVAVPSVVMEELISHRIVPERRKYEKAAQALASIAESTPWPYSPKPPVFDAQRFSDYWYGRYTEIVTVINTSGAALQEAVRRETHVLPPCKEVEAGGKKLEKVGGRDAAIWLTAVEYAREHPDEKVYFVSENTKDFTDGTSYKHPMDEDVKGLDGRFIHLTTLTDVVNEFAAPEDLDAAVAEAALHAPEAVEAVAREAFKKYGLRQGRETPSFTVAVSRDIAPHPDTPGADEVQAIRVKWWIAKPSVKYLSVRDIKAHRIGDHVWCVATVQWLLAGYVFNPHSDSYVVPGGAVWETRVLFSTTQPETPLTVLRAPQPRAATGEEFANIPELPENPGTDALVNPKVWTSLERWLHSRNEPSTLLNLSHLRDSLGSSEDLTASALVHMLYAMGELSGPLNDD